MPLIDEGKELDFNNTLYPVLSDVLGPPYRFNDTSVQIFPLKADPIQLSYLVNSYLNIVPREVAWFAPAAPYVLLSTMSIREQGQAAVSGGLSFGFTSESQAAFIIPLIRYQVRQGKKIPVDFGFFAPFIFTSSDMAMVLGRTIFGFANRLGWFQRPQQNWAENPNAPRRVLELGTHIFPDLWLGKPPESMPFFTIDESPPLDLLRPSSILNEATKRLLGPSSLGPGVLNHLFWLWKSHNLGPSLHLFLSQILMPPRVKGLPRGTPEFGVITLKQFRDAENENTACFQALLNTPNAITWVRDGGLLGASRVAAGDTSGGIRIRLNLFDAAPIAQLLGLQPIAYEYGQQGATSDSTVQTRGPIGNTWVEPLRSTAPPPEQHKKARVAILEPTLPFQLIGNFYMAPSQRLCWRLRDSPWFVEKKHRIYKIGKPERGGSTYNTSLGPTMGSFTGPFEFPDVPFRILNLSCSKSKLQKFCNDYLNCYTEFTGSEFNAIKGTLLLIVRSFGTMVSNTENVGSWATHEVQVLFPVNWKFTSCTGDVSNKIVLLAPYHFSSSEIGTITFTETSGFSIQLADIEGPSTIWPSFYKPEHNQPLMRLWGSYYPSLNLDTYPGRSVLLEIIKESSSTPTPKDNESVDPRKTWMDLINNWIDHKFPMPVVTLKQFRQATLLNKACFQAITAVRVQFESSGKFNEGGPLAIKFHHNPQLPLVDLFGIEINGGTEYLKSTQPNRAWSGGRVDCQKVDHYTWIVGKVTASDHAHLAWRALGKPEWQVPNEFPNWLKEKPASS